MPFPGPILKESLDALDAGINILTAQMPKPLYIAGPPRFRYNRADHGSQLFQVLKAVGVVSGLNAIVHLIRVGHHYEAYVLLRTVSDALADIAVIDEAHSNQSGPTTYQKKMIEEFFAGDDNRAQEILKGTAEPVPRVGRRKKYAALERQVAGLPTPEPVRPLIAGSDAVLDGFTHCGYGQIMDLYSAGPTFNGFRLRGIKDPERERLAEHFCALFVHRALNQVASLLRQAKRDADATRLIDLRKRLEASSEYPRD